MAETLRHSTAKQWGFLLTEALLIVASILLAFALDSWWDERGDRVEEQEILQGLRQEFLQNREKLEYRIVAHRDNLQSLETMRSAADRGSWGAPASEVDPAFAALIAPPTTDLGNGVLEALISAGRMELLGDRGLRARLANWRGVLDEVLDDEIMLRGFVVDTVIPKLIQEGVPMSGPMSSWPGMEQPSRRSPADTPGLVNKLLRDPGFRTLLDLRLGFMTHATGEYEAALRELDEIVAEIEASLER